VAKGTSITREARRNYIPVADSDKKIVPISNVQQAEPLDNYRGATFYSTHATPTARQAGESYDGSNQNVTTSDLNIFKFNIDGFLASYNIDVDSTFSFDNNFIYSDHMPVAIKFSLKAPSQNY
jgi:hypothetical protein